MTVALMTTTVAAKYFPSSTVPKCLGSDRRVLGRAFLAPPTSARLHGLEAAPAVAEEVYRGTLLLPSCTVGVVAGGKSSGLILVGHFEGRGSGESARPADTPSVWDRGLRVVVVAVSCPSSTVGVVAGGRCSGQVLVVHFER